MVNVASKRCLHHGCGKVPSFGVADRKMREFCAQHKRAGMMVDVTSKGALSPIPPGSRHMVWIVATSRSSARSTRRTGW